MLRGDQSGDTMWGGNGSDILLGGGASDTLYAYDRITRDDFGNNRLYGQVGDDYLSGGTGNDLIDGGIGNDDLESGGGTDQVYGCEGDDLLFGGEDSLLDGGFGNDEFIGSHGQTNTMLGRAGNDVFRFGGQDTVSGGGGNDQLTALGTGALDATVTLGSGADVIGSTFRPTADGTFWYRGSSGVTVTDFTRGEDKIGSTRFYENISDPIFGNDPDDIVVRFADLDTNDDGLLNGADRGVSFDGGLVINLGVGLREAATVDVAIGQAMLLKLAGIAELDATDFTA